MIGQTLGHYRIVEKIGAGGMGEVYRAHDEQLDRDVAVKVLPGGVLSDDAARRRFRKEALALAKLNHPNIETVFEFSTQDDVDFLVTEYIPGVTLSERLASGPLVEKELTRLGPQLAEGLAAAHAQNVMHRDLKPANLRVTPDARLKILDFGLAKLLRLGSEPDVTASLTETHAAAGTLAYMAPEQLRGEPADLRSDIYAAGAVLYEMASGRRPFEERLSTALVNDIIHKLPPPPGRLNPALSPKLEDIILKCLEKEADNRYQSARELVVDLRNAGTRSTAEATQPPTKPKASWRRLTLGAGIAVVLSAGILLVLSTSGLRERVLGRGAPSRIESLAVLPLENLSSDPEQEYFADAMTEALITDLGQISALRVISRTSAMQYKRVRKPLPQIGRELNVNAVIEGSVLRSGNRVRITAQLIEAPTDRHLWAASYERDLGDILALQDDIAAAIAREIQIKLTPQEQTRLASARPVDPETHEAYLKGRFFWNQRSPEGLKKAIEYFRQALARDPKYALAYAGIADVYYLLPSFTDVAPGEAWPKAREAAQRALELDETLAEAHTSLAFVKCYQDWDWDGTGREFRRAIELNPNYATAHLWYGRYLSALGRHDQAIVEMKRAQEIDPFSAAISGNLATAYYLARQYNQASQEGKKAVELAPNSPEAHLVLGSAYREERSYREAIAELQAAAKLSRGNPRMLATLAYTLAVSGDRGEARRILGQLKREAKQHYVSHFHLAAVYVGLGENDHAFEMLRKAYGEHSDYLIFVNVTPIFDPLHSDPRFKDLLLRMGLPP